MTNNLTDKIFIDIYGMSREEILSRLSDAINVIDKTDNNDGLGDDLMMIIGILRKEWNIEEV